MQIMGYTWIGVKDWWRELFFRSTYRVDEIVGENPEVDTNVPNYEPNDCSNNGTANEEHKEVPGHVPDAKSEPLWPNSE